MSKWVMRMSELHKTWRKAKEDALKEAKKADKATARKVEKWMKNEFDRGLGERLDDAHKAFAALAKAWDLVESQLDNPEATTRFQKMAEITVDRIDAVAIVLDAYGKSLNSSHAQDEIPSLVVSQLSAVIATLDKQVDGTRDEALAWKKEAE